MRENSFIKITLDQNKQDLGLILTFMNYSHIYLILNYIGCQYDEKRILILILVMRRNCPGLPGKAKENCRKH
jgi:hypothetical protein